MKKLLSIALVATVALGSMNMQAGDGAKKAWAVTKIAYGVSCLVGCIATPILEICLKSAIVIPKDDVQQKFQDLTDPKPREAINGRDERITLTADQVRQNAAQIIGFEEIVNIGRQQGNSNCVIASPLALLPLAILLLQSGTKDLKKLKKNAQKKNAQKDKMLLV